MCHMYDNYHADNLLKKQIQNSDITHVLAGLLVFRQLVNYASDYIQLTLANKRDQWPRL